MSAHLDVAEVLAWFLRFADRVTAGRAELGELDRLSGDGDFGDNVAGAVTRAQQDLAAEPARSVADVVDRLAAAFARTGGTSGPLLGAWFRAFARELAAPCTTAALAAGASAGLRVVQRLGGAQVGDRTMVDALVPAAEALLAAARVGQYPRAALHAAADAAAAGARSTADLVGRRGRSRYVGEAARGVVDPGAAFVAVFFAAAVAGAPPFPISGTPAELRPVE